jgi:hypothetical protein
VFYSEFSMATSFDVKVKCYLSRCANGSRVDVL